MNRTPSSASRHLSSVLVAVCPTISCNKAGAVGLDQMSLAQNLQRPKNVADHPRDLGLADAGRSGEHHVLADGGDRQALFAALLLDLEPRGQRFDLLLDRRKADHGLELFQRGGDRGLVVFRLLAGGER